MADDPDSMGLTGRQRTMSEPEPRARQRKWVFHPLLGLLVILVFLGHDVLMAALDSTLAAERPSLSRTPDLLELHVSDPHPQGCDIGQKMVLDAPDAPLRQSTIRVVVGHPILTPPAGLPSHAAIIQARSPTAQRAVLQIFRI